MSQGIFLSIILLFSAQVFGSVTFSPGPIAQPNVEQIRVQFPTAMEKVDNPFTVTCDPNYKGYGNWADNNTTWVYNIELPKDRWGDIRPLPGGASCSLTQTAALQSTEGQIWAANSLVHKFVVQGPTVTDILVAPGFSRKLREQNPVFMVVFDGEVKRDSMFLSDMNYLSYTTGAGLPVEKMDLTAVPQDQAQALFETFQEEYYLSYRGVKKDTKNWVLVTTSRNLIAGASVDLTVGQVKSAYTSGANSIPKAMTFEVRDNFKAEVNCSRLSEDSPLCRPESGISVRFNAKVKWEQVKGAYLDYVPKNSPDGKVVRVYANEDAAKQSWLSYINATLAGESVEDIIVERISFANKAIAADSTAKVVFPSAMQDIDQRTVQMSEFTLDFGSFSEVIKMPSGLVIMEKNLPGNDGLPIGVMNLNQKINIKKSGAGQVWTPITNMQTIMALLLSYENLAAFYSEETGFKSPLDYYGLANTTEEVAMMGQKNKLNLLTVPYATEANGTAQSGLYVAEVRSELDDNRYPKYAMTMVTDMNIHLKTGASKTVVWVTSYSTGLPVEGAQIKAYNCMRQPTFTGVTDKSGLATIPASSTTMDCGNSWGLRRSNSFFVQATTASDMAYTHSAYSASNTHALSAPGIEYFYSDISDNNIYIHTLVGVNLVKPGQKVPVQLTATMPTSRGFKTADMALLPEQVKIRFNGNSDITYDFPLEWKDGKAEILWSVPKAAELGSYSVVVTMPGQNWARPIGTDIEVAEFKVPLMTANIAIEKGPLVKPETLEVSALLKYANGVGAKDQDVDFSFYFTPATISAEGFNNFDFVKGEFGQDVKATNIGLPTSDQVAKAEPLATDKDGSVKTDLGTQIVGATGGNILETLNSASRPYTLVVRMSYTDQMGEGQTVSTSAKVFNAATYLGTRIEKGSTQDAKLKVVSLSVDGKPLTNMYDLNIGVKEIKAHIVGEKLFGGLIQKVIERELVETSWNQDCTTLEGVVECSVGELAAGHYVLEASSKTFGQKTYSIFKVDNQGQVTGENDSFYFDNDNKGIPLAADKADYQGGDVATLSFDKPFNTCTALVSLERGDVIETMVDNQACENGYVTVPVESALAPNVFASVYLVSGRSVVNHSEATLDLGRPSYRTGYANLKIDWAEYSLDVKVEMDKEEYKPGEMANVVVDVTPVNGELLNGEVTLIAIEEKILELKTNDSFKILEAMMGQRRHNVTTVNNQQFLQSVSSIATPIMAKEMADALGARKAGEEGGSGSEFESFKRKLFDSLVSWQTRIPVIDGQAQASFKLNDKLTKFKVFAVVTDINRKFGTGAGAYVAAQDIQSFSNIPPVSRTGDEFPLIVNVFNSSKQAGTFKVVVDYVIRDADGNLIPNQVSQTMMIDSGSSPAVKVGNMKVPEDATSIDYSITVYDENGNIVDAIAAETQEVSPSVPLSVQDEFMVQVDKSMEFDLKKNPKALPGKGNINTQVYSSLVQSTEALVRQSIANNPFSNLTIEGQLLAAIMTGSAQDVAGLQSVMADLMTYMDADGFVKYYKGASRGNFWLTAELVQLVAMKPWALNQMPVAMKTKVVNAMNSVLSGKVDTAYISDKASEFTWMAAKIKAKNVMYALGQVTQMASTEDLVAQANAAQDLVDYPLEVLVDVLLLNANRSPESMMTSKVMTYINESLLSVKNASAVLKGNAELGWWGYGDEIIGTAKLVKAQSLAARSTGATSDANYLDNLVRGLVNANQNGTWYTLRTQSWVVNAMTSFAQTYEAETVTGSTQVSNSEASIQNTIVWTASDQKNGLETPWKTDTAKVKINHNGTGRPWVSVIAQSAVKLTGPNYQGLKVTKEVNNLTTTDGSFNTGDLIKVTVKIETPSAINHVALFDPIPSGSNILGDGFGSSISSAQKTYSGYKAYFGYLPSGETSISYQYQLNNPGRFQVAPTRAEALYEPGLFGEVPNGTMEVAE